MNSLKRATIGLTLCLVFTVSGLSSTAFADVVAITNVRVETRGELGTIENGSVLIRDGIIESVGEGIEIPQDAKVVDGRGATLTPGWIDSQSRLWLTATSRTDTSVQAALRTVDGLDPFDETFKDVVRHGVTSVAVAPEDRGRLGGSVALIAAGPVGAIFQVPTRESFVSSEDATPTAKSAKSDDKPSKKPETTKPEQPEKKRPDGKSLMVEDEKDPEKKDAPKEAPKKKEATGEDKDEKKPDPDAKKDKEEEPEVPYSIQRPPVPYTVGKQGWILSTDMAVQSSLGIAARDGRSRIGEFDGLKKTLTDAEAYHKKWDEYRVWKAKQDKLPPDQRAKVEAKKPMTVEQRRAEMMRRIAAMRAQRAGGAAPKPPAPPQKPATDAKKDDVKKEDDKKDEKAKVVPKPDFDPVKERLRPVLRGEIPLRIAVTDNASLARALELTKIADCQLVLVGVSDVRSGSLEGVNWPVIAGPWLDQEDDVTSFWVEQFERDDVRVCIGTFGGQASDSGTLRMQAAAAVAAGVDREDVLDAVTRSAAEVAGVGSWLGQIQPGFRADLAMFDGDPLDPSTPVLQTMIAGQTIYESSTRRQADEQADAQQRVVALDDEVIERLSDVSMPKEYVLESSRILRPSGKFRPGRVTVTDGKITDVSITSDGATVSEPSLPVLDLGDLVVTPGLVTAHLSLASGTGTGEPDSSYYRAANGFDFQSERARSLVESGVLFAAIAPPSSNVLAGQISAVRLAGDQPIIDESIADKMVVTTQARRTDRFPSSMEGQFAFIRRRFAGDLEPNRTDMPRVVASLMQQDATSRFEGLSAGDRIAVIEARTPAELRGSLRLIKALNLNARLLLPSELRTVLKSIKSDKIGLIVRSAQPADPEWYLEEIAQAAAAGSQIGIAADDATSLRSTAALMVSRGVKPQRVLRMLTTEAAACVGMPKGTAAIVSGQPADLVIWSGPPYKLTSRCLGVLSDGMMINQDDESTDEPSGEETTQQVTAS